MKAQALVDFCTEINISDVPPSIPFGVWNLYLDGSSTKDGSEAEFIIETPASEKHGHALKFVFRVSNNKAEYKELIVDLKLCQYLGSDAV